MYEDHQFYMNTNEMKKYLQKLFDKCEDEATEKKFLSKVGKAADKEDCTRKDLDDCASVICKKGEKECDKVIHDLEDLVGYKKDFEKKLKESVGPEENLGPWKSHKVGQVVVHNETGKEGLVIKSDKSSQGGLDVIVAPLIHGERPAYRSAKLWHAGTYTFTDRTMPVNPPEAMFNDPEAPEDYNF